MSVVQEAFCNIKNMCVQQEYEIQGDEMTLPANTFSVKKTRIQKMIPLHMTLMGRGEFVVN